MRGALTKVRLKKFVYLWWLALMLALLACKRPANRPVPQEERGDFATQTVQATSFNYTKYEIVEIAFDDASRPFDVRVAASAGAVYFRSAPVEDIGNGLKATVSDTGCCFMWNYESKSDVALKIVWLIIFDPEVYAWERRAKDERKFLEALPGSKWCEARVNVEKPYPTDPNALAVHFLPDGSVTARLFGVGKLRRPLTSEVVSKFLGKEDNPHCRSPTTNPWYNIPREKYRE